MQRGNSAASRDIAYHLHPYTNMRQQESDGPARHHGGQGIHVTDEAGKEYIEAMAGLWCRRSASARSAWPRRRLGRCGGCPSITPSTSKAHDLAGALAEQLIAMMPVPMSKVFFNNSGSEANDTAVKLVWYYNNAIGRPRKKKIIAPHEGLSRRHRRDARA